jgi:hypothetical protein
MSHRPFKMRYNDAVLLTAAVLSALSCLPHKYNKFLFTYPSTTNRRWSAAQSYG